MSDKIGLFAGSFDPVTNGHIDLIERAAKLVDTLYVGIFYNKEKSGFFTLEERKRMLENAIEHIDNVILLTSHSELTVDVAKRYQVTHLVRGLRNATDLEYEANLAYFNDRLAPEIEIIFLLSKAEWQYISSSRIRELIYFKANISSYVPSSVVKEVEKKIEIYKEI